MTEFAVKRQNTGIFPVAGVFLVALFLAACAFAPHCEAKDLDRISFDLNLPSVLLGEGASTLYPKIQELQRILKEELEIEGSAAKINP